MNRAGLLGAVLAAMGACTSASDHDIDAEPAPAARGIERVGVASPRDAAVDACNPSDDASAPPDADPPALEAATPALAWYATCGYPVCPVPDGEAPAASTCAAKGTPCTTKGETCGDGRFTCGSKMVCDDHDPTAGGCPISSAKYKEAIHYLSQAELARLHDETLEMRLTTYRYTSDGSKHLGFVVEDQPESMSVDLRHDRVDLYGYLSMAIATLQMQEEEIRALKAQCRIR